MTTQKDRAAAAAAAAHQAERDATADADRLAFMNACNKDELQSMLAYLIGYSPAGFDHAVKLVTRDRAAAQARDGGQ